MIPKPVDQVTQADLQALIDNQVLEGKTVEYKRQMPGKAESDVVPFLAAVSSFANTSGGDLLVGVEAVDGVPTALPGIQVASHDQEGQRVENMLANGLEPRLPRAEIKFVEVGGGRYVLVVRAPRSWVAPHGVKKNSRFYGRTSAGRQGLDVGELRTAFTMSETVAERIRNFRVDRIARVQAGDTPVAIQDGSCVALHLLPLASFTGASTFDLTEVYGDPTQMPPIGAGGWNHRINLDGFVTYTAARDENSRAYTQLFRGGGVEAVAVIGARDERMVLPITSFERQLIRALSNYSALILGLGVEPPVYLFMSFVGVRGCQFGIPPFYMWPEDMHPLREDTMLLPETVVEGEDFEPQRVLRPLFDMVWNAFGFERSLNYDDHGEWVGR